VATAPVLGAPHLLPADMAWTYRSGSGAPGAAWPATAGAAQPRRLVVSGAITPEAMRLPALHRWSGAARPGEVLVELHGPQATPGAVLEAMADADVIELHVHGVRDRRITDSAALVLSPDAGGRALVTPADLQRVSLARHPLVLLGACQAAQGANYGPLSSSLPSALLRAGAAVVLASQAPISDADAEQVLDELRRRVAAGVPPAAALRDFRRPVLARDPAHWSGDLVLFE
jgi:hypothetical protein